ncbi:MAG: hypothetical protein HOC74_18230 [Gemmatimonadetes bacterium]|jgi:hypothetical protein|nr:hypothetical protein [Gemmatimonadota bacterium]
MLRFFILLLAVGLAGCASAPPPWQGGFLDGVSDYYDQGTGVGSSSDRADRNAQIALVGYQQGIAVESMTEDKIQSFSKNGDELIFEVMTSEGVQRVSGTLPAGSYIAERWKADSGSWWSFAVAEKPGKERRIQELRDSRLGSARLRSIVPGWAQFTKGQKSKGWRIVAAEGVGVVGLATFAILQKDYEDRRDRAAAVDYDYYNDWANRFYWGSVTFGTLAGATYLYNWIDGITSVPPTYQLLLSKVDWDLQPRSEGGALLVLKYDIK